MADIETVSYVEEALSFVWHLADTDTVNNGKLCGVSNAMAISGRGIVGWPYETNFWRRRSYPVLFEVKELVFQNDMLCHY